MKKTILIISVVCMFFCLSLTVTASQIYTEKTFEYTIEDESVTIVSYFGDDEEVTVPNMIAGFPVNTIASGAFANTALKNLYLPDSIMTVEPGAIRTGTSVIYNANAMPADNTPGADAGANNSPVDNAPGIDVGANNLPTENTSGTNAVTSNSPTDNASGAGAVTNDSEQPISGSVDQKMLENGDNADITSGTQIGDTSAFVAEEDGELEDLEASVEVIDEKKTRSHIWIYIIGGLVIALAVFAFVWKKILKKPCIVIPLLLGDETEKEV